jgi:hypothetical protein
MYELIELSSSWFDDMQRLSPETLASLMKMGSTIKKLLEVKDKLRFGGDKSAPKATDAKGGKPGSGKKTSAAAGLPTAIDEE